MTTTTQSFDFQLFATSLNHYACWLTTAPSRKVHADSLCVDVWENKLGRNGRLWSRRITLVHRATEGYKAQAESVMARLIEKCEANGNRCALTTEHGAPRHGTHPLVHNQPMAVRCPRGVHVAVGGGAAPLLGTPRVGATALPQPR